MAFSAALLRDRLADYPTTNTWWVAYSGGLDSTVLLHALANLGSTRDFSLRAIHADHGLQPESGSWVIHCQEQCRSLGVPLTRCDLQITPLKGESLEALARESRYHAFSEAMDEGDLLLTAQHADDQVETVLLQLLRGAGVDGLAAMSELGRWRNGWLARPLLAFAREDLQTYALDKGINWIEDPSNLDQGFDRNYLRQRVIPLLKQRWPGLLQTVPRSAAHCASASALLAEQGEQLLAGANRKNRWQLPLALLDSVTADQQANVLRSWIRSLVLPVPSHKVLSRITAEVLDAAADASPLVHWNGAELRRYRQHLYLMPPLQEVPVDWEANWDGTTSLLLPAGLGILTATFNGSVSVRFRGTGQRCRIPGKQGSRTFKQISQELGIPPWLRDRVPLLFVDGDLVAIGDFLLCEGFHPQAGARAAAITWERAEYLYP